jgi:glycosyltransferase involved in cell wall biosynthesis
LTRPPISVLELRSVRGTGGGPEKTILYGAERHARDRFAVTVCYLRDVRDEVFGIDRRAASLDIDYVEIRERHSFDRGIWRQLVALVRDRRFDIVHGHDYKTNFLAWLLGRRTDVIPMATSHGWTGNTLREKFLYYPGDKRLVARLPRAIAVSSDIKRELVRHGARPDRVTVLLNGIDPKDFHRDAARRPGIRASLGLAPDDAVIGAVGRVERQKRFDLLLEAFAPLSRQHPSLRLLIAGDGSLRDELIALAARLGLDRTCRFLGLRHDIADLHHAFDLFVQSSEYEGTPNAVLEAMAMETPIVATDVGGTAELAADGVHAIIVPPHDVAALQRGIDATLRDPAGASARVRAARQRIEGELSFDARTRTLEGVYEQLVAERDGRRRTAPGADPSRVPHA